MTDAQLLSSWMFYLGIAAVIVVAAAALLVGIWLAARRILKHALEALEAVERIQGNTRSIWALKQTNQRAGEVLARAESIRDHGALVARALSSKDEEQAS